jgi:hypothetical protein
MRTTAALLSVLLVLAPVAGDTIEVRDWPPSLRELTIRADSVVLTTPLVPIQPTRFRVVEVLRGKALKVGDTVTLADLGPHDMRSSDPPPLPGAAPTPNRIGQALVFLEGGRLVPSGLRFCTTDGRVLAPERFIKRGKYSLVVQKEADWSALVARARSDGRAVEDLLARKALARPAARARALLAWAEERRREMTGRGRDGWGKLETELFDWVLACGAPADCWAAVRLHAELNRGRVPASASSAFATPEGRALLLRVALDAGALAGDRLRALSLLAERATLWPEGKGGLSAGEQADLLDRLARLLGSDSGPLRAASSRAVLAASHPEEKSGRRTKRALAALVKAYQNEGPGPARDDLAEAVCVIGGAGHWRELTGNPPGLFACLRDLAVVDGDVRFWLDLRQEGGERLTISEQPALVLERRNLLGIVVETKRLPLPVVLLPRPWSKGWDGSVPLLVRAPVKGLAAGTWRVSVQGMAGRQKWASEPGRIRLSGPAKMPR